VLSELWAVQVTLQGEYLRTVFQSLLQQDVGDEKPETLKNKTRSGSVKIKGGFL
jgi:hypothetical protein